MRHLDGTSYAERLDDSWLAQLFDGLDRWWNDLSVFEQILVIGAVATAPLWLPLGTTFGFGKAAIGGLSLAAGAWTVMDKADETADFIRDPVGTVKRYWAHATPGSLARDALTLGLTAWLPGKVLKHLTPHARRVPAVVGDYAANPRAYWAAQRTARRADPSREAGEITYGHSDGLPRINKRRPINYRWAGDTYGGPDWRAKGASNWSDTLANKYPKGVQFDAQGFPVFDPYAKVDWQPKGGGQFTGDWKMDVTAANADMREQYPHLDWAQFTDGYTWHHVEDGRTMQLVPRDLHTAVKHTGGVAVIK